MVLTRTGFQLAKLAGLHNWCDCWNSQETKTDCIRRNSDFGCNPYIRHRVTKLMGPSLMCGRLNTFNLREMPLNWLNMPEIQAWRRRPRCERCLNREISRATTKFSFFQVAGRVSWSANQTYSEVAAYDSVFTRIHSWRAPRV